VVFAPLGPDRPDLTAIAADVLTRLGAEVPDWPSWTPLHPTPRAPGRYLRGLFSGGTLCVEAQIIAAAELGPVRSNVPVQPDATVEGGHLLLDLGADEYTVGRPHPMIDLGPRLALIAAAAADPDVGVLLLDVVLGHGAHPDPAGDLAPAIAAALSAAPDRLAVVVSLVGTPDDPQGLTRQAGLLCDAGASVYLSNAEATRRAVEAVR
jgi:FdrA protein